MFVISEDNRDLSKLILCENPLPWVNDCKHLGNRIDDKMDGMKRDIIEKRARFINKNNELCQEFFFSDPRTLFEINCIYNSHFTGSPLWDLFGKEAQMVENSWSTSIKLMFSLHRRTHRYFLEPVCEKPHIRKILAKRFLSFTQSIRQSKKVALWKIFDVLKHDCCSVTGANLRQLMLLLNKDDIDSLVPEDGLQLEFAAVPESEAWKIPIVKEILELKPGEMTLPGAGLESSQIDEILQYLTIE